MSETPPPSFYGPPAPGPQPPAPERSADRAPERSPERGGHRRGLAAAVLTGSLVLGGLGGLGGAAAWDTWLDDETSTSGSQAPARTTPVIDQGGSEAADGSVEAVATAVLPSVVRIDVRGATGPLGQPAGGSGSGIVLSEDGQILTNEHVISAAGDGAELTVSFADGTRAEAEVLGSDPMTDTAVIQAQDVSDLTPATLGQSGNLQVGQSVVAIGSPFGLDATVTSGIVSALDRPVNVGADDEGNATTYPAIQTDAAINPGNSGGPLVDLTGSVVGINSSIRTASSATSGQSGSIGLGFAIPLDEIMPIVDQMSEGETPTHGQLGVRVSDAAAREGTSALGALVAQVTEGGSAAEAGIREGDVITRIDGEVIDGSDDLVATVRTHRPGDEVELTYERDGEEETATVTLDSDAGP